MLITVYQVNDDNNSNKRLKLSTTSNNLKALTKRTISSSLSTCSFKSSSYSLSYSKSITSYNLNRIQSNNNFISDDDGIKSAPSSNKFDSFTRYRNPNCTLNEYEDVNERNNNKKKYKLSRVDKHNKLF